jgi:hypothetical protein
MILVTGIGAAQLGIRCPIGIGIHENLCYRDHLPGW